MASTKKTQKKHWLRRRWGVLLTLGIVCALVAGGVWVAFFRGSARADLFEKGVKAYREKNLPDAKKYFREVLKTQPENSKARGALISILMDEGNFDEAEPLARTWTDLEPGNSAGWRILVEIALRRFQLDEAERMARAIADQAPHFAQLTIMRVRDVRGSYLDRLRAVEAAINLSSLGSPMVLQAEVHIYAAETLLDLVEATPEAAQEAMRARAARYRDIAQEALKQSDLTGQALRNAVARTRLLADSEQEQARGAQVLKDVLLEGTEESESAAVLRAGLARYYSARGEWDAAGEVIRDLRAASPLAWFRAVRRVVEKGPVELALSLLDEGATVGDVGTPVTLLRAQALLRGSEAQKKEGRTLLTDLVEREKSNPALGIRAYTLLSAGGEGGAGLELLESVAGGGSDVRAEALLANELASDEASRDRAMRIIETLPGKVENLGETLEVLRLLRRGGGEALQHYLDAEILAGGAEGARQRLIRAAACVALGATASKEERVKLRAAVVADLGVLDQSKLSKADLARAWLLALDVGETKLAGSMLARAIAMDGSPYGLAYVCVQLASKAPDQARRDQLSEGVLSQASGAGPSAFLQLLGTAVARKPLDEAALLQEMEGLTGAGASAVPALFLVAQMAFRAGDHERAEAAARALLQQKPDVVEVKGMLGDLLLLRKDWEGVLALHADLTEAPLAAYRQRVAALLELERAEEALEAARLAVRTFPRSPEAHLLLAQVHLRADRRDEALGVLSVAPMTIPVALLRAELLTAGGEKLVAELLFAGVLAKAPDNLRAIRGMATLMTGEERSKDVVAWLTDKLDAPSFGKAAPERAELLVLRGMAEEKTEEMSKALRDYEAALEILPRNLSALNNAAWLILQNDPDRIATAEDYIGRALQLAPKHPSVLDTAAQLDIMKGDHAKALERIDGALAALEKPSYMMRRAEILEALDRKEEARAQLELIVEKYGGSDEAVRALDLLR